MTTKKKTTRDYVHCDGNTIEYLIIRSNRREKTMSIVVNESGIIVYAPIFMATKNLRQFIIKRSSWILRHQKILAKKNRLRFINGETFPFLGLDLILTIEQQNEADPKTHVSEGRLRISIPDGLSEDNRYEHTRLKIMNWYHIQANKHLPETAFQWWKQIGYGCFPQILVRNQRCRWGSCAVDGTIRLNWRLIMMDQLLVDYIIVHELSHLKIRNHSVAFWNLVAESIPDFSRRRGNLNKVTATLPL